MKNYKLQLEAFSFPESKKLTKKYFDLFWLDRDELNENWRIIKNNIYNKNSTNLFEYKFNPGFEIIPFKGGLLLTKEEFEILKLCMKTTNDTSFVIIEDYDDESPPHNSGPPLRFKYPADITWQDIMGGGYISIELFQMSHKNYFVFGDSGEWGKYVANDYKFPLDIVGFKNKYAKLFKQNFILSSEERNEIYEWLPEVYKRYI